MENAQLGNDSGSLPSLRLLFSVQFECVLSLAALKTVEGKMKSMQKPFRIVQTKGIVILFSESVKRIGSAGVPVWHSRLKIQCCHCSGLGWALAGEFPRASRADHPAPHPKKQDLPVNGLML